MKYRLFYLYLTIAVTTLMWTGCTRVGPEGPAGLDGINADVTTSPWFSASSWTWDKNSGVWYFDEINSAITKDIVENGIVLAYVSLKGDVYNDYTVRPLPAYALGYNWDFLLPNNGASSYSTIEFTTDMASNPGTVDLFRFVLIPAGYILKSERLKSTSATDLKKMPYKDVCKLLGIKE